MQVQTPGNNDVYSTKILKLVNQVLISDAIPIIEMQILMDTDYEIINGDGD